MNGALVGPTRRGLDALSMWGEPVLRARYVDASRAEALARLGIDSVEDLLRHYPFRYIDLTSTVSIAEAQLGVEATIIGRVHDIKIKKPKPRLTIVEVAIVDGTGVLLGVWFNQPYMANRFVKDESVAFAGTMEISYGFRQINSPFVEKLGAESDPRSTGRILPVHRATEGLSTNWMRRLIGSALDDFGDVPDFLPAALRIQRGLLSLKSALRAIHFPEDMDERDAARHRLAYEELLCLQVGMAFRRHRVTVDTSGIAHDIGNTALTHLSESIPFELTADQTRAIDEIFVDMAAPRPMNRMLLGDVGTGKTAVAAHALCAAAGSGHQAAMMAPTEVLASQYARTVGPLLDGAGTTWALLTGSTPAAERHSILERLEVGELSVLLGTHALLETAVSFRSLSLAVIDEQHRFGVGQRLGLRGKGASADLLVMTATPIPRSLAMTLYGDLDTSYLREVPTGSREVETRLVRRNRRQAAYDQVRAAVAEGRQAYVVCALVDESDASEARAANKEAERLRTSVFSNLRVGLLTGKMRPADKVRMMESFRDGAIDVLVATTVIEVGVDVPNASVMIIEDADRFGLSQLHQLRGRIGRGGQSGTVLLFSDSRTDASRRRMETFVSTDDGFELAEADLALRGEGHLLGERQHGIPELRLASLAQDGALIDVARTDAAAIVESDPRLGQPVHAPLGEEVARRFGSAWEWISSG